MLSDMLYSTNEFDFMVENMNYYFLFQLSLFNAVGNEFCHIFNLITESVAFRSCVMTKYYMTVLPRHKNVSMTVHMTMLYLYFIKINLFLFD